MRILLVLVAATISACAFEGGEGQLEDQSDAGLNCVEPPSGIIGWWDGEELGVDITGINETTVVGSPSTEPGHVGSATRFRNTDASMTDMIRVIPSQQPSDFTLETWVYLNDFHQQWISLYGRMADSCFALYGHKVTFWEVDLPGEPVDRNVALQVEGAQGTSRWHHVAFTYVGNQATTYVNGEVVGTQTVDDVELPSTAVGFGGAPTALDDVLDGMDGSIDELTLYDRALDVGEIVAIVQADSDGKCKPGP